MVHERFDRDDDGRVELSGAVLCGFLSFYKYIAVFVFLVGCVDALFLCFSFGRWETVNPPQWPGGPTSPLCQY